MHRAMASIAACAVLAACAKNADQVGAVYTSPVLYEGYTCPQLAEEAQRVQARAMDAAGVQERKATGDAVAMGVGLIIFWPTLLMIKGNDENTAELGRLKGQMDAIEQTAIKKRCSITFQKITPTYPTPEQSAPPQHRGS